MSVAALVLLLAPVANQAQAARVGPMRLCRPTVVGATIVPGPYGGLPVLEVRLSGAGRGAFARLTRGHIGRPLPVTLDGRVVMSPQVNEQVRGGVFHVAGADARTLLRLRRIVLRAC